MVVAVTDSNEDNIGVGREGVIVAVVKDEEELARSY